MTAVLHWIGSQLFDLFIILFTFSGFNMFRTNSAQNGAYCSFLITTK